VIKEVEILGHRLPVGTHVIVSPGATHHLSDYWSDPMRFDPERFGSERAEHRRHPFMYVPFGGGAHKCIGMHFGEMEIKSIVHQVLSRFRLRVSPLYEMPIDYTSLPYPSDGLPIQLERL
jgi:cytochrome P450